MEPCVTLTTYEAQCSVPATALEHRGFRDWVLSEDFPPRVRASYVAGEIFIDMSPESIDTHNKVKLEVSSVLHRIVQDEGLGEVFADRVLLTHEAAQVSHEPDALFASWEAFESGRLRRVANVADTDSIELVGTPDLVVEIISDSSVRKDRVALRARYARAGIPEYWLIDARSADVSFEILVLAGEGYERADRSRVLGRAFALSRTRNRIGGWEYRLTPA